MYKLTQTTTVIRLSDGVQLSPGNVDFAEYQLWLEAGGVPQPADTPSRAQWEEAAIRRAARLLAPNRVAVESLLLTRPSVEHEALRTLRLEIIRISTLPQHAKGQTLVSLAASTDETSAFLLLNAAYAAAVQVFYLAIAAIDPSPAYRADVKRDFDLVIDQMKAAL